MPFQEMSDEDAVDLMLTDHDNFMEVGRPLRKLGRVSYRIRCRGCGLMGDWHDHPSSAVLLWKHTFASIDCLGR